MISNIISMYSALNGRHQAAMNLYKANDGMMGLLNTVGPNTNPAGDVFQKGLSYELQAAQAKVMFAAYSAWEKAAQEQVRKDFEHEARLRKNWYA